VTDPERRGRLPPLHRYLLTHCEHPVRAGRHRRRRRHPPLDDRTLAEERAARPEQWLRVRGAPDYRLEAAVAFIDGVVGSEWAFRTSW